MPTYAEIAEAARKRTEENGGEDGGSGLGKALGTVPVVGGAAKQLVDGPKKTPTGPAEDAKKQADALAAALEADRQARLTATLNPNATSTTTTRGDPNGFNLTRTVTKNPDGSPLNTSFTGAAPQIAQQPIDTTQIDLVRKQQEDQISALRAAAEGKTPSAADIQSRDAASKAASQQYGLAAALQGGMSAGGALRQASQGAAQVQGEASTQGAILRAQEQSRARDSLTSALSGQRGQEQEIAKAQADVRLQTDIANQRSKLTSMGLDAQAINALLAAQLQAQGYSMEAIKAILAMNQANTQAQNDWNTTILKTAGTVATAGAGGAPAAGGVTYGANGSPILD